MTAIQRIWLGLGIVLLAIVGVAWRVLYYPVSVTQPVLIAADDDAHALLSPNLDARVARAWSSHVEDRQQRPRLIALTFDDGPYPIRTPLLASVLHDLRVPATFFLIGRDVRQQPALTRMLVGMGFEIANHTQTHPNLDTLSARDVHNELVLCSSMLSRFTDNSSVRRYFRPPHGRFTEATIRIAQKLGYMTVLWSDDPGDRRDLERSELIEHVVRHATAPEILLLHSGSLTTIDAVADIVERFRGAGYRFVTVSELLRRASSAEINHPLRLNLQKIP